MGIKQPPMNVIQLQEQGIIGYLFRNGMVSSSMVSYIDYYGKFQTYRREGKTYREAIRQLSEENHVSETTIKKAVRIIEASMNN
jgi:hypothetical protein